MPVFNYSFQKKLKKPDPIIIQKTEDIPRNVSVIKKEDIKPKLKNKIKVKNNSNVKLKNLTKKIKDIHIEEAEDTDDENYI